MCGLPNMSVVVPCDVVETRKATNYLLLQHHGPKYIRFAREATPVVTDEKAPFVFGKANVVRFRKECDDFLQAFETKREGLYQNEHEDLTIVACGPMVPEAMRGLDSEAGIWLRDSDPQSAYSKADRSGRRRLGGETDGGGGDCGRTPNRRVGMAGQQHHYGKPSADGRAGDHWGHRREGSFWRFGRALGTHQGVRSQRGTHRP